MKYMACCVKFHEISRQISDWPGKKKKKKKHYVTNWRKNVKELENRTLCVTNLGKSAQGT